MAVKYYNIIVFIIPVIYLSKKCVREDEVQ